MALLWYKLIGHCPFYCDWYLPRDFVPKFHSSFPPCVLHSISIVYKHIFSVKLQPLDHNIVNSSYLNVPWATTLAYLTSRHIQLTNFRLNTSLSLLPNCYNYMRERCEQLMAEKKFFSSKRKDLPLSKPNETLHSPSVYLLFPDEGFLYNPYRLISCSVVT